MKRWRIWHKWLGLIVGLQVLLWISGGVVMSAIPLDIVRGEHILKPAAAVQPLQSQVKPDIDFSQYASVAWHTYLGRTVLKATNFVGQSEIIEPLSGAVLAAIDELQATELARFRYLGDASVQRVELLQSMPQEVSHLSGAFYKVSFDDWARTRFYIDANTAEVRSVRSDIWQFYDFFWMLHIMDYDTRKDFNNPLLIVAAVIALGFTMSGIALIYFSLLQPKTRKLLYYLGLRKRSA